MASSNGSAVRDYSLGMLIAILILVFSCGMLTYVVPVLRSFVASQTLELPFALRLAIGVSRFWWLAVAGLVAFLVVFERSYQGDARAIARRDVMAAINLLLFLYAAMLAGSVALEFAVVLH